MTYNDVSVKLRRSSSTVRDRIRRLEDDKVILGYYAIVNAERMGMNADAIVLGNLAHETSAADLKKLSKIEGSGKFARTIAVAVPIATLPDPTIALHLSGLRPPLRPDKGARSGAQRCREGARKHRNRRRQGGFAETPARPRQNGPAAEQDTAERMVRALEAIATHLSAASPNRQCRRYSRAPTRSSGTPKDGWRRASRQPRRSRSAQGDRADARHPDREYRALCRWPARQQRVAVGRARHGENRRW